MIQISKHCKNDKKIAAADIPSPSKKKGSKMGMKCFALATIALGALFSVGCAHHRDVRPGADGVHRVVLKTDDTEQATRDAISQANHFCKQRNQMAAFVSEEQKYTGDMDEKNYKAAKTAAKVATMAGGTVGVFGGRRESTAGGVVATGGVIANEAIGKGYTVDMKFKCQ